MKSFAISTALQSPSALTTSVAHFQVFIELLVFEIDRTSKTPEGRSATFRVRGSGFSFLFFFDLNCCTISRYISDFFEPSRR